MAGADSIESRVDRLGLSFNAYGVDPYGITRRDLVWSLRLLSAAYRHYFRMRSYGLEHIPARGRAMLVGNHSGGIALDAAMVLASCFLELEPPRLAQGMAEKFLAAMPWAGTLMTQLGQSTGLPENAERLLNDDRLLMIFPEGAKGTAKLYADRWSLVDFGTGFVRLALKTGSPIVPFGFIGGGDAVPTVANLYTLGKLVGAPYLPVTPYLLPIPRPVPLEVHYGEPLVLEGTGNEDDETIAGHVAEVKARIATLIEQGREARRRHREEA